MIGQGASDKILEMDTPHRDAIPRHTKSERKKIATRVLYGSFYNAVTVLWVGAVVWVAESAMEGYEDYDYVYPLKNGGK